MPSNPSTLLDSAKCFQCSGASLTELLKLALLDAIAGEAPSNPSTLLESVKCFQCSDASVAGLLKLALLDIIAEGGLETNNRITELGDIRITQNNDIRVIQ